MKTLLWKTYIDLLKERRNGYLLLASGSILLNILMAGVIALTVGRERVILVPPEIERPLSVTSTHVSPEYLSDMSLFLSDLLLNVTPDNAAVQHAVFLRYVAPDKYGKLKGELLAQEEHLVKEHMTVTFNRTGTGVDLKHMAAKITGVVEYRSGTTVLSRRPVSWRMTFGWHLGRLTVKSFEEESGLSGRESHV